MLVSRPGHRKYEGDLSTNIEHQNRRRAPLLLKYQEVYDVQSSEDKDYDSYRKVNPSEYIEGLVARIID